MKNKILPLGSVVTLKDGDDTELMIITRGALVEQGGVGRTLIMAQ